MRSLIWIIGLISSILVFACSESATHEADSSIDSVQAFQDTMLKWEHYMESSSEGLWEDSVQYDLEIERIHSFGGEDNPNPQFYRPYFVHIIGDTLLITDDATVTMLDRFSTNGQYLDSYCLPDSEISIVSYNGNGYMVAIQSPTGTIFGYRIGYTINTL